MPVRLTSLRRPSILVNAALGVLVLAGAGWAYTTVWDRTANASTNTTTRRPTQVTQGTVTATAAASSATVLSASTATAAFVTSGTVTAIKVKVGDLVKKDQVLATVDPTDAQHQLDVANANLTAAQASLTRAQTAGSDTTDAATAVTTAQLAVTAAQTAVDGTVLKAPMAGTVTSVSGTVGASSGSGSSSSSGSGSGSGSGSSGAGSSGSGNSGTGSSSGSSSSSSSSSSSGFIQIQDLTKLEVYAYFAEADATKIKAKQAATVTWNALSSTSVDATVASVDPNSTTSNSVVSYGVVLSLGTVPPEARPGQTLTVSVTTGEVQNVIRVPTTAVRTAGGRRTVVVTANGQQTAKQVEVGLEGDSFTEITSGLTVGEQVVLPTTTTSTTNGNNLGGGGLGGLTGGAGPGGGGFTGGGTGRTGTGTGAGR